MKHYPQSMIIIVFSLILGMISGKFIPISPVLFYSLIGVPFLLFIFRKYRNLSLILFIFLLGWFRYNISEKFTANHLVNIIKTKNEIQQPIRGHIVSEIHYHGKKKSAVLELISIKNVPVKGKISFYFDDYLQYGDVIETVALIKKYSPSTNPFSFDYSEYLRFKGIYGIGFAKTEIKKVDHRENLIAASVINMRRWLRKRIKDRFGKYSPFIRAIVIGEKQELGDLKQQLNYAGLSHILAVSGLHVGVLSLVLFLLLKTIIPSKIISRIILIILLIFYGAICSWSPSVSRSVIMISIYMISKILQRKTNSNRILAISLMIITFIAPRQLFSIGLQLSFAAVFILLNILPRISFLKLKKEDMELLSLGKKILNAVLLLMFSSLIISFCLAPLTLYYFHQFNLNGIVANVLAIPLISIILPLSFVIIFVPSALAVIYFRSFSFLMRIFFFWSSFSANLPFHFDFLKFSSTQFIISLVILLSFPFVSKSRKIYLKYVAVFLFFGMMSLSLLKFKHRDLKITFFDVDVADMFLIETPDNEDMMIDTGPPEFSRKHFKNSALGYFRKRGISHLNWIIITHAHNDHYGGLVYILQHLKVDNLAVTDDFQRRSIWNYIKNFISEKTSVLTISDTTSIKLKNIKCNFIHPDKTYYDDNINNMSIVTHLDYKNLHVLFTGDLEKEGENFLLQKYIDRLDSNVLKVGHHGSKTSSTPDFIRAVSPDYAFISASMKNKFGFPCPITLQKYEFLGDRLFITGKDGASQLITDGNSAYIKSFGSHRIIYADFSKSK